MTENTTTVEVTYADLERTVRQRVRFHAGRARINDDRRAACAVPTAAVRAALDLDLLGGLPAHGRATRIARKLRMPRSTVARILSNIMKCSHLEV